ncbi:MAG: hypothetical protein KTR18_09355 [Acidiferrobacterales bacterium]|nr:hypothetical protein [Acidiferrobacterales bacterium]
MLLRKISAHLCACFFIVQMSVATAADVVIGVPNWPSVQATAHVLKVAMEKKLGLTVELQNGSNDTVIKAIDAGSMHVHPEVWLPNLVHLKRQFVDGKKTIRMNPNSVDGTQAMCVTKGTAERTGIKDLSELRNPEMASQFDSNGDGKGDIWIGAEGWGSTTIERIRARSYGYDQTMSLMVMEENEALDMVDGAVNDNKNVVFFCYTPHHMFATHDLVKLNEPPHDATQWTIVQPSPTPGWLEKSRAAVAWDTAKLHINYAASLETEQPDAAAMLSKVALDNEMLTKMTYALVVEKQDPAVYAEKWVEENQAAVDTWFQ